MKYGEQECWTCKYEDRDIWDEPCAGCKNAISHEDAAYDETPLLWESIEVDDVTDIVNHPNHYTNGGMECIDEMVAVFGKQVVASFCLCNVWKYRYRALSKNGQQDIDKSHWYMKKYLELRGCATCE